MRQHAALASTLIFLVGTCLANTADTTIPKVIISTPKLISATFSSGPKTIISRDQIAATGVISLSQTLQHLGGVQLLDTTGNNSQVMLSMRGFGANASSNTLLLVNGIPITNPDMAPPDLNAIPLSEIESIEIIAGSESVLYGDQAVGGIINIHTREHTNEKIELSCGGGSYNQRYCIASLSRRFAQILANAALEINHTDNYREHNNFDQYMLRGGIRYDYSLGNLNFNFNIANENMQYPGALTSMQIAQNRRQATNNTDYFKDLHDFFHLHQQHDLNSTWRVLTDMAYRQMNGRGVLTSSFTQSRSSVYFKPQLTGKLGNFQIKTGIDWQADRYQLNSVFGTTNDRLQKYGIFAIGDTLLTPLLGISIGIRGAQQNNRLDTSNTMININRAMASTLGISYQLTSHSKLYLRRAESFRFPKADENASISSNMDSLRTQRGASYEAGAEMNRELYSGKVGIYLLHLKDEITFDPLQTPEQPFGTNKNLDHTIRHGATISAKYHLSSNTTVDGQFNFVNARFQSGVNKGKRIPLVSANIIRGGIDWRFLQNWHFYTDAIFTGGQYADNDDANVTKKVGGYTICNFNFRYDYLNFSAGLHLNNIFNQFYYFYSVYQSSIPSEYFYPAPGRNFTLTMNYAFA